MDRLTGVRVAYRWWEQEGIDSTGTWESADTVETEEMEGWGNNKTGN